jgi:hypothetical protein
MKSNMYCFVLVVSTISVTNCGSATPLSSSSSAAEFTCDPPDACPTWRSSINGRLCDGRTSDSKCGDLYKAFAECASTHCTFAQDGATPCDAKAQAWQMCNSNR